MVFLTRPEARDWRRKTEKRAGRPQTIYKCSWCGYWHLTTMPRGVAKKARLVVRAQVREARRGQPKYRRQNPLEAERDDE